MTQYTKNLFTLIEPVSFPRHYLDQSRIDSHSPNPFLMRPLPFLLDMPLPFKERIVSHVDPLTKIDSLIRCSKEYKKLVEESPVWYHRLDLNLFEHEVVVAVEFSGNWNTWKRRRFVKHEQGYMFNRELTLGRDCIEEGVKHFVNFWKNPHARFGYVELSLSSLREGDEDRLMNTLNTSLSTIGHQVYVKTIGIEGSRNDHCMPILSSCKPGILDEIRISSGNANFPLGRIAQTEQWKQAKRLTIEDFMVSLPYEDWRHFEDVHFEYVHVTLALMKELIQKYKQNPRVDSIAIICRNDFQEIKGFLADFEVVGEDWRIPLPDRNEYVNVGFDAYGLTMSRETYNPQNEPNLRL